jgi:hypothetical protein
MNATENRLMDQIDNTPDYPALFRSSESYDDFMEQCGAVGADADEASMMWTELNSKYSS